MESGFIRKVFFLESEEKGENTAGPFWSFVFLISTFVTIPLGFYRVVPWQFILSGLFGLYGSYRIIRYGIAKFWHLGHVVYRGCRARLIGLLLSTLYLGLLALGVLMAYKGVPGDLP